MADPTFEQFQAWINSQKGAAPVPTVDEVPDITIADVLCALVRSASLPDETTSLKYQAIIQDHFAKESTLDSEAAGE